MTIRELTQEDFFLLNQLDWSPLPKERDSIYLILSVDQAGCSFVAEDNREFLGVLLATRSADSRSVYVNHLLISTFARRQGVGGKLLGRLEDWAVRNGVARIWLLCQDETVGWYTAHGYSERFDIFSPEVADYLRSVKKVHAFVKEL